MKKAIAFLLLYSLLLNISTTSIYANESIELELNSHAAVLMDADNGIVLYQKNSNEQMFPASITKVMTALVALDEIGEQLDRRITVSNEAVVLPYNYANIAMNPGDTLTMEEALYALMIASANDVANAIAENIGTTFDNFIVMMNEKAESLGATGTNFVNPSGMHDEEHVTTAHDMALIMREAVHYPLFLDFASSLYHAIPPTETQPEERPLNGRNRLLLPGGEYYRDYILASKTGFVTQSMHTLVSFAERDGRRLIAVVLSADQNMHYEDTIKMFERGFDYYRHTSLLDASDVTATATVVINPDNPESNRDISLYATENIEGMFPRSITYSTVELVYEIPDQVSPPVQIGDRVGTLFVKYQDITLGEVNLYASEGIEVPEPTNIITNTVRPPIDYRPESPRHAGGFSFGFLGDIFSHVISMFPPIQLDPFYFMIVMISLVLIVIIYFMTSILNSKNRDRDKELLKLINRDRKKSFF